MQLYDAANSIGIKVVVSWFTAAARIDMILRQYVQQQGG